MSKRGNVVDRPLKRIEFTIKFASKSAAAGWQALLGTQRNAVADAWDWLTKTPLEETTKSYPLKAQLKFVVRDGKHHVQWQHKLHNGARIWYYVEEQTVYLVEVHTRHPNETK